MKCKKCGATIPDESKFCLSCGNEIKYDAPQIHVKDENISNSVYDSNVYNGNTNKKANIGIKQILLPILCILIIPIVALIFGGYMYNAELDGIEQDKIKVHEQMHTAYLEDIKNKKWDDALDKLSKNELQEKCHQCNILRNYVTAMKLIGNGLNSDQEIIRAYNLVNVNPDFNGPFADDIKKVKTDLAGLYGEAKARQDQIIAQEAAEQKRKLDEENAKIEAERAAKQAERDSHVYIGDDESKIRKVFGTPDHLNRTVIGGHVTKQYVYDRGSKFIYIYTKDGIVTGFQD